MIRRPPRSPLFPSPPLSRSNDGQPPLEPRPRRADRRAQRGLEDRVLVEPRRAHRRHVFVGAAIRMTRDGVEDRKSTRLNSSHGYISYAVFCLKKKKQDNRSTPLSVSPRITIIATCIFISLNHTDLIVCRHPHYSGLKVVRFRSSWCSVLAPTP